jgi:asparagine synthase (glutamine-hydrolysing)
MASVNVTEDWIRWLCTPEYLELIGPGSVLSGMTITSGKRGDSLDEMLRMDTECVLPDNMLTKVDIASMANSLEVRAPMVDHYVMQFAAALPTRVKLRGGTGKYILRQAVYGLIPNEVVGRRKHGFDVPVDEWLRGGLKELTCDLLLGHPLRERGQFNVGHVRHLIEEHMKKRADLGWLLWRLLILELWYQWVEESQCESVPTVVEHCRSDSPRGEV